MKYLKKSKMYQMAKKLLPDVEIPSMVRCTYKFYRGSEWLEFNINMKHYKVYHEGHYIRISGWTYTSEDVPKSILFRCYSLSTEGETSKVYEKKYSEPEIML